MDHLGIQNLPIDQISPGLLIGGILLVFTFLGFLRRFVAFFFNLVSLAAGVLAGLWTYNNGYLIAARAVDQPEPWMSTALGLGAFVLTVVIIRKILAFLSRKSSAESQTRTGGFGLPGGSFGLLFGFAFAYFMLTGVRYAGTMAELDRLTKFVSGQVDESSQSPFFAQLKAWVDESLIGQWHQRVDYLNDPIDTNAAKLAIVHKDPEKFAKATGNGEQEVIYDAVRVDPAIQEAYDERNYAAVLRNQENRETIRQSFSDQELRKMNVEKALGLGE